MYIPSGYAENTCKKCGSNLFITAQFTIHKPAFMTKSGKDENKSAPLLVCLSCHTPIDESAIPHIKIGNKEAMNGGGDSSINKQK